MAIFNPTFQSYGKYAPMALAAGYSAARNAFGPKSNSRMGLRGAQQTLVTSRRKKKFKSNSFHSKLVAASPAKHYSGSILTSLLHNLITCFSPPQSIVPGDAYNQRDGDFVDLIALKLKGIFQTPTTSNGYSYRIIVGYSGEEYTTNASALVIGLTDTEVFLPITSGNWAVNGIINPKAFTAIYDQTVDINSLEPSTAELSSISVTVPLNKKYPYQANASIFGKDKNLYVVVIGSVVGGVAGTTPSGSFVCGYDLIYKSV